jgi:FAD/FMN-containing dehydrogenase
MALRWFTRAPSPRALAGVRPRGRPHRRRTQQFTDTGYPTDVDAILLIDIDGTREQVERDTQIVEQLLRRTTVELVPPHPDFQQAVAVLHGLACL